MVNNRFSFFFLMFILIFFITGCGMATAVEPTPTSVPTAMPLATATPMATSGTSGMSSTPPPAPGEAVPTPSSAPHDINAMRAAADSCNLINSQDLAHLFPPHNEITYSSPKTSQVTHPPFSSAQATGTETQCVFYDFHQPGGNTGWMLQATDLADVPDSSAVSAWSQAWTAAKEQSGKGVSGLGDEAFTQGTNLYIKKGDLYITFLAEDTHVDAKTASGVQQLIQYETQLATTAMSRLK